MVELSNRLVEDVTRKGSGGLGRLLRSAKNVDGRIFSYLGLSPTAILFAPIIETSNTTATRDIPGWHDNLMDPTSHARGEVREYLRHRAELHGMVQELTHRKKYDEAARYDRGITIVRHFVDELVMVYQKNVGKLVPRWRDPFRISRYGSPRGVSLKLRQSNGRRIAGTFIEII